ncbi:hypothetical protein L0244_36700 [bacterium]|nr:hypothetical protein [bacterium]
MIIRLPELKLTKEPFKKAIESPKFSWRRMMNVLDAFDLELAELTILHDSIIVSVDHIEPAKLGRLLTKLQKRAIPKSEWKFKKDELTLYENIRGRICSSLTFERVGSAK